MVGSDFVEEYLDSIKLLPIVPTGLVEEKRIRILVVLFPRLQMFISVVLIIELLIHEYVITILCHTPMYYALCTCVELSQHKPLPYLGYIIYERPLRTREVYFLWLRPWLYLLL